MGSLKEVWIIDYSGVLLLYAHDPNLKKVGKIDPQLFSGIFGALNMLSGKRLNSIVMHDSKLHIFAGGGHAKFHVIGRLDRKVGDRRAQRTLEAIHERFAQEYGGQITSWSGDIETFTEFRQVIEKSYF